MPDIAGYCSLLLDIANTESAHIWFCSIMVQIWEKVAGTNLVSCSTWCWQWTTTNQPMSHDVNICLGTICMFGSLVRSFRSIFWAVLVQFGLGIMCWEGFWEVQIFGFFRPKSSNLEELKIQGMDVEMALYLRKYKYLVKEVYWWNVVYCMGVWEVAFDFWFLKIFIWFLGGVKGRVKISDFMKVFKMVMLYIWVKPQ